MASFENTLDRMKALYTYGKDINESKKTSPYTLEHRVTAADGNTYGIVKECNKYYIKKALPGKEMIAESYEYLGGFCNKSRFEYGSYNSALKNLELKLSAINEACDGNVITCTLDPFKKEEFIVEGTERMKNIIARQRQIMYNAAMLMNEATDIGASRKSDVVKYDGKNPEAESGKRGDEGYENVKANPEYAGSHTNGVDTDVAPFNNKPGKGKNQLGESCDCGDSNCDCDWGSEGIGKGRDPKQVGWDIEGQTIVNEEEDWGSAGLPSTPGVGEADTDHNNGLFTQNVNESEEEIESDVEASDEDADVDMGFEEEVDDFDTEDGEEFDGEEFDVEDFDTENDEEFESEDDVDFESEENSDIMARISELEAELAALKNQVEGGEEMSADADFGDEELSDENFEDGEVEDFESELDADDEDGFEGEEEFDTEGDEFDAEGDGFEIDKEEPLMEAKRAYMNKIVNSVVSSILNEDVLHDFGKHPGYRKKPMELPSTGEDKNQWGEDWNDESVYSEEPFGSKIGSSAPFENLVDAVTKEVMTSISGEAFKKKVK